MENKERFMTTEEKEKFLQRVKIETEDFVGTGDPKAIFEKSLHQYQKDMCEQIKKLNSLIKVQQRVKKDVETLYAEEELCSTDLDLDTIKAEISTKDEVINGARASAAVMKEKVRIGEKLIPKLVKNYDLLCEIDFYFGGVLNLSETPKYINQVVENNVEK